MKLLYNLLFSIDFESHLALESTMCEDVFVLLTMVFMKMNFPVLIKLYAMNEAVKRLASCEVNLIKALSIWSC
jgi:hypothetical protein